MMLPSAVPFSKRAHEVCQHFAALRREGVVNARTDTAPLAMTAQSAQSFALCFRYKAVHVRVAGELKLMDMSLRQSARMDGR